MLQPINYSRLFGSLRGISDRALSQHLDLYRQAVERLTAIEAAFPMTDWTAPTAAGSVSVTARSVVQSKIGALELRFQGQIVECLNQAKKELQDRGVNFVPNFYLGDGDFWTTDRGCSINIPWFLANPIMWRLANRQALTCYTVEQVMRCLRHEIGHAVGYAFETWKRPDWRELFGDMEEPYQDYFATDALSEDHVEYLTGVPSHYAQKHPDEDWAETFARWMDPVGGWAEDYSGWPIALRKLQYVESLAEEGAFSKQSNSYLGQIMPYRRIQTTVAASLGTAEGLQTSRGIDGWSEHAELLRREPHAYNDVRLHEAYFDALGRGAAKSANPAGPGLCAAIERTWGSWESYKLDLRAIAASVGNGWVVTVWDPRRGQMRNALVEGDASGIPAGCPILVALDCHEHAFALDYGNRRDLGVAAWFENVNWITVEQRLIKALGDERFSVPAQAEIEVATGPTFEDEVGLALADDDYAGELEGFSLKDFTFDGGKYALRTDLTPVEVDVHHPSGTIYKAIRWKRPDEAKALIAEGRVRVPSPERLKEEITKIERVSAKLKELVTKNPEGFSYRMAGKEVPTSGFMVSREAEEGFGNRIALNDPNYLVSEQDILDSIDGWVQTNIGYVEGNEKRYFGGYLEMDDKQVPRAIVAYHFDVSDNIEDKEEAEAEGGKDKRNQESIWDVVNQDVIQTGGTGKLDRGRQMYPEGHWHEDEVPKNFYLALDLHGEYGRPKAADELMAGTLDGVQGLGGSKETITNWWGVARNALIVMDGKETVANNKLEAFKYDDPYHLTKDNMAALYRMWDKRQDKMGRGGLMFNLTNYTMREMEKNYGNDPNIVRLLHTASYIGLQNKLRDAFETEERRFDNPHDLADWMRYAIVNHFRTDKRDADPDLVNAVLKIPQEKFRKIVFDTIKNSAAVYRDEAEYRIKDAKLNIPSSAKIYILRPLSDDMYAKWKDGTLDRIQREFTYKSDIDSMEKLEAYVKNSGLDKKYRVFWVDYNKFDTVKHKLIAKKHPKGATREDDV